MTEHSINRSGTAEHSDDDHTDPDADGVDDTDGESVEEERTEAEKRRQLRESVVGRAILGYDRRRRGD